MNYILAVYIIFIYFIQITLGVLIIPFIPFIPYLRRRFKFEKTNSAAVDIAFEVASEGELEQVMPLIEHFAASKKIKIIYSSESVATKCKNLSLKENIIVSPLPILRIFPIFKINAPILVFCRYDFYPNLLYKGLTSRLILVSASLKGKSPSWYRRIFYRLFDLIIPVNSTEEQNFKKLGITTAWPFDFRILQINSRLSKSSNPDIDKLKNIITDKSLIIGSCWPSDLQILSGYQENIKSGSKLVIVPHKLDLIPLIISKIKEQITDSSITISKLSEGLADIIIVDRKGILLELYSLFKHALVGGGFGISVHSLLEPYIAGCICYCGPNIYRSTEYDLIKELEPLAINIINETTFKLSENHIDLTKQKKLIADHLEYLPTILREIDSATKTN